MLLWLYDNFLGISLTLGYTPRSGVKTLIQQEGLIRVRCEWTRVCLSCQTASWFPLEFPHTAEAGCSLSRECCCVDVGLHDYRLLFFMCLWACLRVWRKKIWLSLRLQCVMCLSHLIAFSEQELSQVGAILKRKKKRKHQLRITHTIRRSFTLAFSVTCKLIFYLQ